MNIRSKFLIVPLGLLLATLVPAGPGPNHNTACAQDKKIILERADRLQGGEERSPAGRIEQVRTVSGNVVFRQENLLLRCDRATEFLESGTVKLRGDIFITDGKIEVYCDNALYFPDRKIAELEKNVRSRTLEDDLRTKSKRAKIDNVNDRVWIFDDAVAWQDDRQLSGDSIMVQLAEIDGKKKAKHIVTSGKAFFAARDTADTSKELYNQLSGRKMTIDLKDGSGVEGIRVESQARSLYHTYDGGEPSGVNYSSGNVIEMFFREGKLHRILVSGNVEGKQYPDRLRGASDINLPGFRLRFDERPQF